MSDNSRHQSNFQQQNDLDCILFSKSPNCDVSRSFISSPPTTFFTTHNPLVSDYTKKNTTLPQPHSINRTQEELEYLIGEIPFPQDDASMTSFSASTHSQNTPQKPLTRSFDQSPKNGSISQPSIHHEERKPPIARPSHKSSTGKNPRVSDKGNKENFRKLSYEQPQQKLDEKKSSFKDSLTPDKMNKFMDWSKNHVTIGDGRTIFPQIIAPSIEISGDNSQGRLQEIREDLSHENTSFDLPADFKDAFNRKSVESNMNMSSVEETRLRVANKQLSDQLQKYENEANLQKKLYKKLEQENSHLSQRVSEQQEQLEFLQEKYRDKSSLESLRGKNLENAKMQIKQLKTLLEKKEDKISELMTGMQKHQTSEESLKVMLDKEVNGLHNEINRQRAIIEGLKKHSAELERENQHLRQAGHKQVKSTFDNLNSQLQSYLGELGALKEELAHKDSNITQLNQMVAELNRLLQESQYEIREKDHLYAQLKRQMNESNGNQSKNWENERRQMEKQFSQELKEQKEKLVIQIEQLKQKNADLENELHEERAKLTDITHGKTNDNYENSSKASRAQGTQCNSALEAIEKTMISLSIYDSGLTIDQCLQKFENEYSKLREKLLKTSRELDSLKLQHESLQSAKDHQGRMIEKLQRDQEGRTSSRSNDASRTNSPRKQDKEIILRYNEQIQALSEKLLRSQEENIAVSEAKRGLESKIRELEIELKNLSYEAQRVREEYDMLKLQKEKALSDLKARNEEINQSLRRRVEELELRNSQLTNELQEQERVVQQQRERLEDDKTQQELALNLENANKGINYTLERKIKALQEEVATLTSEITKKDQMILKLKNDLTDREFVLEDARRNREDIEKIHEDNYERLREHMKSLEADNMKYLKESQEARDKIKNANTKIDELQKTIHGNEVEIDRLKRKLKDEFERFEYTEKIKNELERENKGYYHQVSEYEAEIKELRSLQQRLSEEANELRTKITDMEIYNQNLQKEKKSSTQMVQSAEMQKGTLAAQLEDTKAQLVQKLNEVKALNEKLFETEKKSEKLQTELTTKSKELDKMRKEASQKEKQFDLIQKEKAASKERIEELEERVGKEEALLKEKEQSLKQLEIKVEQNDRYMKEKDKKNVDLFNQNKNLQERIKALEEINTTLKTEIEKKTRSLAQKANEIKSMTTKIEGLESKNAEMESLNGELKNGTMRLENEISLLKLNLETQLEANNNSGHDHVPERIKSPSKSIQQDSTDQVQVQMQQELTMKRNELEKTHRKFQSFLEQYKKREQEFEVIKEKFLERIVALNEKVSVLERKYTATADENNFLNVQLTLHQKNANILQSKILTLEKTLKKASISVLEGEGLRCEQKVVSEDSMAYQGRSHRIMPVTQRTERTEKIVSDNSYSEPSELKSPEGFRSGENLLQLIETKQILTRLKPEPRKSEERPKHNNIFLPEMLSTEETVDLVVEVLRRASSSAAIAGALKENAGFRLLAKTLKKEVDYDQVSEVSTNSGTRRPRRNRTVEKS